MSYGRRLARARALETLEARVKQFRSREEVSPFRVPHEPLLLDAIIQEALADGGDRIDAQDLRSRTVIRFEWRDSGTWDAWAIVLPSGVTIFCDSDGDETRMLASLKRGSAEEADRFFLELLAESKGQELGIEMAGVAPDRVRTSITDRAFLTDVFVELFEGTRAERAIERAVTRRPAGAATVEGRDFHAEVQRWLDLVLVTPTPTRARRRKPRRLRDEAP